VVKLGVEEEEHVHYFQVRCFYFLLFLISHKKMSLFCPRHYDMVKNYLDRLTWRNQFANRAHLNSSTN
jgi:hypothetical protein